jgi:hypothetical protein
MIVVAAHASYSLLAKKKSIRFVKSNRNTRLPETGDRFTLLVFSDGEWRELPNVSVVISDVSREKTHV